MEILEQFFIDKGLSASTRRHYIAAAKLYEELNGLTLQELLTEADSEEESGVRWKKRTLKKRLIAYRNYLFANKVESTAKVYLSDIKAIYRYHEIESQPLPSYNSKQIEKVYEMKFKDLPQKEELIDVYYEAQNVIKCWLLFALSSGVSMIDMDNMTVADFMEGCKDYVSEDLSLIQQLKEIKKRNDLVPVFYGNRQKTGKSYITFCSPEASTHIVQYLIGRDATIKQNYEDAEEDEKEDLPTQLELTDKLFDVSKSHVDYSFRKMNAKLNIEKVGRHNKIRCHMFRKWQASTLFNCENGFTIDEVDTLQGRSKDKTHRSYFLDNEEKLREKYICCVDELMLFQSLHGIDKEAYAKLENENKEYKHKLNKQEGLIKEIQDNQKKLEQLLGI